jgi:Sulfite exporter TauE/SafE
LRHHGSLAPARLPGDGRSPSGGERPCPSRPNLSIHEGPVAPDWPTGIALGIGGIAGGYVGARMQSRLPDTLIRRTVGILAIAIAAQFLRSGLS